MVDLRCEGAVPLPMQAADAPVRYATSIFITGARRTIKILLAEAAAAIWAADYLLFDQGGMFARTHHMYRVGLRNLLAYNNTRTYSPIILNTEWSPLWRLVLIIFLATTGTVLNGFFVSSFFVENSLRKVGNVYLACVGLADMVISSGVMPAAAVVLLSKIWEISEVCYFLQFLTQASTYTYSLLFMMVAVENYIRLCRTRACYVRFISLPVGLLSTMIFVMSFATSGYGVYYRMDYDYCTRNTYGNYTFRLITSLLFHGIPFMCTGILLGAASLVLHARTIRLIRYKRSKQYDRDYSFTKLNIGCYILYVAAWLPYLVIVHKFPNATDSNFYSCVWLGLSRSIITSLLYCSFNGNFRHAFARLFNYCCCKNSLNTTLNHRQSRSTPFAFTNVRVHIMHHSMRSNAQRTGSAGCLREESRYTSEI